MNMTALVTDNITDVLVKIINFTRTRQKLLTLNINNAREPGFVPMDLPVDDFCQALNEAIAEHIRNRRLLLRDTENIKFGCEGAFEVRAVIDEDAKKLLAEDPDRYLESQLDKLLENSLNQRIAAELLKQKQGNASLFYHRCSGSGDS